jgi:urease accessory protein
MAWHARLQLGWRMEAGRCVARFEHDGPLRILQSLHPEGPGICHNVLVHPPGGLVGGDTLALEVRAEAGSHGLLTTPGAARFYRSEAEPAVQRARVHVAAGARVEWVPLETLYYPGCMAENHLEMELEPGGELIGWDVAAFGLPHAQQPFVRGRVLQHVQLHGAWLERAVIDALDHRLMDGPLGLAGHRCLATLFFCTGEEMPRDRRDAALEAARAAIEAHELRATAGATAPNGRVVVVRALSAQVEPALGLLKAIRRSWRRALWQAGDAQPRGWAL